MADELIPPAAAGPRKPVFASGLPPGMEAPTDMPDPSDATEPDPQEQGQYDQLVAKIGKFVWADKKGQGKVLAQLNDSGREFFENAGRATYQMVRAEMDKAKAAGVEISPDAAFHAAADSVVPWLFELASAAKIVSFETPEQE